MAMQFTRNYDLLNMFASGANYWDSTKSVGNNWRLRFLNGTYQQNEILSRSNGYAPFEFPIGRSSSSSNTKTYIDIGTSGTAFTYDDYNLTTFKTTAYSDEGVSFNVANDNSSITVTMYQTFLNSSGSEQTVREIGLINTFDGAAVLIAREVLETPIVVPANGYFKIQVTFTVAVPTNLIPD